MNIDANPKWMPSLTETLRIEQATEPLENRIKALERENAELRGKLELFACELEHSRDTRWNAKELRAILNEGQKQP